jgi:hypothetical protein
MNRKPILLAALATLPIVFSGACLPTKQTKLYAAEMPMQSTDFATKKHFG